MELVRGSLLADNPPVSVEAIAGPVLLERCLTQASGSALNYSNEGEIYIAPPLANKTHTTTNTEPGPELLAAGDMGGVVMAPKRFTYPYDWRDGAFSPCRDQYFANRQAGHSSADADATFLACYPAGRSQSAVFSTMWTHKWKASVQTGRRSQQG